MDEQLNNCPAREIPQPALLSDTAKQTDEYAVVEVFGHRQHVGRIFEVENFGAKLLRVDVPTDGDFALGFSTHFYGGASIFSLTPCDRATVERMNKPYVPPASRLAYREPAVENYDPFSETDDGDGEQT